MKDRIRITKTQNSRLSTVDFDNIPFGRVFSDHMFVADFDGTQWADPRIVPFGPFEINPACLGLHYGQSIFEGMKATKTFEGVPFLFRPEMHAKRLNRSAERMCMPNFPEELFLEALDKLIDLDEGWIPPQEGSALYIRPLMFANGAFIGVKPSDVYRMIIFTGPVGPYYPKPVRLVVEEEYVRAVKGGAGEAKAAGNYGAALLPSRMAEQKGFDQLLWLDGFEHKYIQEVGTMNIFFVIDGKVITPESEGAILRGITRESIMQILRDKGYEVQMRPLSIDEVVEAHRAGLLQECFGSGTAAVVAHVSDITYRGETMDLPPMDQRKVGNMAKAEIDGIRSGRIEDRYGWLTPVGETVTV